MYQLPSELTTSSVIELQTTLIELLTNQTEIKLDISSVLKADTASVQLLCSLQKSLIKTQQTIQWHGKSDALFVAAKTLGVQEFLALTK